MSEATTIPYLSEEWHAEALRLLQSLPARPGVDATIAYAVTGAPGGDIRYHQILRDGVVCAQSIGSVASADVMLTAAWDDAVAIGSGGLDASVAFMQGRLKVSGDNRVLLAVLAVVSSPEYRGAQQALAGRTVY